MSRTNEAFTAKWHNIILKFSSKGILVKNLSKKQMLMTTLLSAATIGAAAIPAHAQDTEGDEIIVTGSRLNQANIVSSSPVVTLSLIHI